MEWSVAEPQKLSFEDPVTALSVRVVDGTVNVVGTDGPARLEVSRIEGPPLKVTHDGGTVTIGYEDLPWKGLLKWLEPKGRHRAAVVSVAVPAGASVEVGAIGAAIVISGVRERTQVRSVSGDTTLVGLSGPVRAESVSGNLEAQAVGGDLRFQSVAGDLTVLDGAGTSVRASSVSGDMVIDLDESGSPTDIDVSTVSGDVAIRLPHPADARVEANTAGGHVSSAFEDLRVSGQWGAKKITGTLGAGTGTLRATAVSGSIALLRRPPSEPYETAAAPGPSPSTSKEL